MKWFRVNFDDVFFNGLTTAEVGCVIKYKCMCQQCETDTLSLSKLRSIFTSRELKFVQNYFGLCSKNAEVCSNNLKVCSNNLKVCSEKDNKNKELEKKSSRAYISNNINNNIKEKTDKRDKKDIYSGKPPEKDYAFEGKIIKLNQKDFDEWQRAYPDLNLRAELLQRDSYLQEQPQEEQKKWFLTTSQYFIKRNEVRKAQNADIAEQYNATANNNNNDWF